MIKESMLTFKLGVLGVPQKRARPKVDQLQLERRQIHEHVLVLDVAMNDAVLVNGVRRLDNLSEEVARNWLGQRALVCDVVEEIDGWHGPLHDEDEAVGTLKVFEKSYDARDIVDLLHQSDLHRDSSTILRLCIKTIDNCNIIDLSDPPHV